VNTTTNILSFTEKKASAATDEALLLAKGGAK